MPDQVKTLPASVDIGSHSTILLIADFEPDANGKTVLAPKIQKVEVCRLGEDVYRSGEISEERLGELSKILSSFRATAHALGAEIKACAMTEAARKATNSEAVLSAVEKALWVKPQIISGEEEAAYTFRAVEEWHGEGIVTVDIGGGSTEVSDGESSISIPVGALFLYEKMGAIPGPEYKKWEKEELKGNPLRPYAKKPVYLVGGTGTALAMVFLNSPEFDFHAIEGLEMNLDDLEKTITKISNVSKELRSSMPGLEKGRSDVIICGLYWLRSLLSRLHAESFRICTAGLRFGLLYPPKPPKPKEEKKAKKLPPWLQKKKESEDENAN
jgi:exopolyphosphatase / guanosine-5'-triphosphate,3'-diphosphate pyrophosphatase